MIEEKLSHLKKFTLLLVDDDAQLLSKMETILSIFFDKVVCASDGLIAYEIFSTQKIDMVMSDYTMPNMSGYELCSKIRKTDKNIPLVIMSNYSDKEKLLSAIPLSLAQYLIKPVSYTTLTSTLLSMLDRMQESHTAQYQVNTSLVYDKIKKELRDGNTLIPLSKSEIVTLELFLQHKDTILSNEEIERCLDPLENKSEQAIKSLIYRLRKKLGKETILNIPGFGYMYKIKSGE